jgi:hypothetical protein
MKIGGVLFPDWGGSCPVQYEVDHEGHHYYVRYKHSWITITVDNAKDVLEQGLAPDADDDGFWNDEETNVYLHLISDAIRAGTLASLRLPTKKEAKSHPLYVQGPIRGFSRQEFEKLGQRQAAETAELPPPSESIHLNDPKEAEERWLKTADARAVLAEVIRTMDGWLACSAIDPERLGWAGECVGKAHRQGIDARLIGWLDGTQMERRHIILCWFLGGYWEWAETVHKPLVNRFMKATTHTSSDSLLEAILQALYWAFQKRKANLSPEERLEGRQFLLQHLTALEVSGKLPGTAAMLRWLRDESSAQ